MAPVTAPLLVGCAAGFSGDRTDAARPVVDTLIRLGGPAVLIFETLAERTLALAQLASLFPPAPGGLGAAASPDHDDAAQYCSGTTKTNFF